MNVRYTLTQGGATIASGEETIRDMAYLMTGGSWLDSDSLRYEKTMLDDWFRVRIAKGQPPRG
jgi:hypothetical protein